MACAEDRQSLLSRLSPRVLGGVVALLERRLTGLTDDEAEHRLRADLDGSAGLPGNEPVSTARPLLGNGFDPSRIYAARSRGVVTVFAQYDEGESRESQGSGFVVSKSGSSSRAPTS